MVGMCMSLNSPHSSSFSYQFHHPVGSSAFLPHRSCLSYGNRSTASCNAQFSVLCCQMLDSTNNCSLQTEVDLSDNGESNFLHVQTLRNYPIEKLSGEVVLVRFDSALLLEKLDYNSFSVDRALYTIKYLHGAGAKVLLVSNWGGSNDSMRLATQFVADFLSSVLQLKVVPVNDISVSKKLKLKELKKADVLLLENLTKFKEELANYSEFSEKLSSGVAIFVNDAFSLSHKILSSTVGVARFCYASVAGFNFEEELLRFVKIAETSKRPYVVIIGGGNFLEKSTALRRLAYKCDGLVFVGILAFQIMHALGIRVPLSLVEHGSVGEAVEFIQLAHSRNVQILFPSDFWCVNDNCREQLNVFPANGIMPGWTPIDLGPISLKEIYSLLTKCEKVIWIGPVKFGAIREDMCGASELALMLDRIRGTGCDVVVVGNAACKAVAGITSSLSLYTIVKNAAIVWEFLKGRALPGVAALDRAYPLDLDWYAIFNDPTLPLIADIGSGNGLFLLNMARRWKSSNFLGLDINEKLVRRCLDNVHGSGIKNGYFISTNATSTFRSIVSSYPGKLVQVSIQCPNPDFNRTGHRWRMVQRQLVEAITDLLITNGKVFLQSDIEAVATRMKEQFIMHGKGKLSVEGNDDGEWLKENPFGIQSDWEQHVLDRGAAMYRLMIRKIGS